MADAHFSRKRRSMLGEVEEAIGRYGLPRLALFTTYTFDPRYFQATFGRLIQGDYQAWEQRERVNLVVVVDSREYPGGAGGNWVRSWPGLQLFHPKIVLLVFKSATILWAGSGNLTASGQEENLEVCGRFEWDEAGLPEALAPLVRKVSGVVCERLAELGALSGGDFHLGFDRKLRSQLPLGRSCSEVVCMSPFFDVFDGERGFLRDVIRRTRPDLLRLYLPANMLGSELRVLADRRLVKDLARHVRTIQIYPVVEQPLHAKLLAFRRGEETTVFLGSANATHAAWSGGNVECIWRTRTSHTALRQFLPQISAVPHRELRFSKPQVEPHPLPCPVLRAQYSRRKRKLVLEFAEGKQKAVTVRYLDRRLRVRGSVVFPFVLAGEWEVVVRSGQHSWTVPIECVEAFAGLPAAHEEGSLSPDQILSLLSGAPLPLSSNGSFGSSTFRGGGWRDVDMRTGVHDWFERARHLSTQMHSARRKLDTAEASFLPAERDAVLDVLERVFDSHDPHQRGLRPQERAWRYWVRVEVVDVLRGVPGASGLRSLLLRRLQLPRGLVKRSLGALRSEMLR